MCLPNVRALKLLNNKIKKPWLYVITWQQQHTPLSFLFIFGSFSFLSRQSHWVKNTVSPLASLLLHLLRLLFTCGAPTISYVLRVKVFPSVRLSYCIKRGGEEEKED